MSAFYGPESPRPFSVVSEHYQRRIEVVKQLPLKWDDATQSPFSFGEEYEKALCHMVSRLGEVNVDDAVCYVGPSKGSLADVLEDRLKLIKGIKEMPPGEIVYEETNTGRLIPVAVSGGVAEEHFQKLAHDPDEVRYDKVILRDSLECLVDRKSFFLNVMRSLQPDGRMLIIQRPADMLTLPYFSEAKKRIHDSDVSVMDTINEIQSLGFDVEWDIEILPIVISRLQWLTLLYHRYPNQLEITAPSEIYSGLRELSEGSLKYLWDRLEFNDRLLFVNVSAPLHKDAIPECRRFGGSILTTSPAPLIFHMPVTDDLQPLVKESDEKVRKASSRREWFGTMMKEKWEHVDSMVIPSQLINRHC